MAQSSGPISQGTAAERQFTDVLWRDRLGDEAGVLSDLDGSSYAVTLPTDSDVALIGSSTQNSLSTVAGFVHRIPAGNPEPLTIPAAVSTAKTHLVVNRYNPTNVGLPGPVRLTLIEGTSTLLPIYDDAPPGVEDLPLWSITRQPGQALSQAAVRRIYPRIGPSLELPSTAPMPVSSPLATRLRWGNVDYIRQLNSSGTPVWVPATPLPTIVRAGVFGGWRAPNGQHPGCFKDASGIIQTVGQVTNDTAYNPSDNLLHQLIRLPEGYRPKVTQTVNIFAGSHAYPITCFVYPDGEVRTRNNGGHTLPINSNHYLDTIRFHPEYTGTL